MTVGVSHTFGGNVVIVDMNNGQRWDLTPDMANSAADKCEAAMDSSGSGLVIIDALDNRKLRYAGNQVSLTQMANDLRRHASTAEAMKHWDGATRK